MNAWYRHLGVLARAVHFRNLTAASQHIGLSQPQLSRLVAQLEGELGVVLLERSTRRQARWTPTALHLARVYDNNDHRLQRALQEVLQEARPSELKAASLEGLAELAVRQLGRLAQDAHWQRIELDVLDQTELEERFLAGEVDVVWTARVPGKGKPRHQIELGSQTLDWRDSGVPLDIMSRYEVAQRRRAKAGRRLFVSNSLRIRELWLTWVGGKGLFPSAVQAERGRHSLPVLLLGSELLPEPAWRELVTAVEGKS